MNAVIVLLIVIGLCGFGVYFYDRTISSFKKNGYRTKAVVTSKSVYKEKLSERSPTVTRYVFFVDFTDRDNVLRSAALSSDRRSARRINETDEVEIVVIGDSDVRLKEDMPTRAGKYFLVLVMAVCIVLLIAVIASELV